VNVDRGGNGREEMDENVETKINNEKELHALLFSTEEPFCFTT
jgi:hypothetical protein